MFYLAYIFLYVCLLSVCLLATSRKNYRSYLHENFNQRCIFGRGITGKILQVLRTQIQIWEFFEEDTRHVCTAQSTDLVEADDVWVPQ